MSSSAAEITAAPLEHVEAETRGAIIAYDAAGHELGHLHFTDYDGVCQINEVVVDAESRRQGLATAMVAELRATLPASRPAQFLMSPDAVALRDAIYDEFAEPLTQPG